MTRPRRIAIVMVALVGFQVGAVLLYRAVERSRRAEGSGTVFATERISGNELAPSFPARRADGTEVSIPPPVAQLRVVHFWATWCQPCRIELPALLAAAHELRGKLILVAVAVDDGQPAVTRFFGGKIPAEVVLPADPRAHKRYGVSTLPDTYLVDRDGRIVERIQGSRDWSSPTARAHLLALANSR